PCARHSPQDIEGNVLLISCTGVSVYMVSKTTFEITLSSHVPESGFTRKKIPPTRHFPFGE
ncbi:MAG: hypothetical protein QGH39_01340, partial [Candidatus Thermoplasmatota archaeon]|nr:hypothetical protein [Candidatus Thermoplasmatota archaeon]